MPLHTANGPFPSNQFPLLQRRIAVCMAEESKRDIDNPNNLPELEVLVSLWCTCFARAARLICNKYNVAIEEFDAKMKDFTKRVSDDLLLWKWLESEKLRSDIGIVGLEKMICVMCDPDKIEASISQIRKRIVILLHPDTEEFYIKLTAYFPNVQDPTQEPHEESVRFLMDAEKDEEMLKTHASSEYII